MLPLVLSGPPGAGKTTTARLLAEQDPKGVHVNADVFFEFIPNLVDPSTPAAKSQNEAIVRAYVAAAAQYHASGFNVYLDGVIGPWMFPVLHQGLGSFDYVLLATSLLTAHARAKARHAQEVRPSVIDRMHPQFESMLEQLDKHVIVTDAVSPAGVVDEIKARVANGTLVISSE